jgi:hypothetical protein
MQTMEPLTRQKLHIFFYGNVQRVHCKSPRAQSKKRAFNLMTPTYGGRFRKKRRKPVKFLRGKRLRRLHVLIISNQQATDKKLRDDFFVFRNVSLVESYPVLLH